MRMKPPHKQQMLLDTAMEQAGIKNTYELAERAQVSPSILYKFRKGRTTRFYGSTQLRLAAVLPNLFGQRTLSAAEMKEQTAKLGASLEKTKAKQAKIATAATKKAPTKAAAGKKVTPAKKASPAKKKTSKTRA